MDKTFRGTDLLRDIEVTRRPVQYLYRDATHLHFMDDESYEQFSFGAEELGERVNYLVENIPGLSGVYLEGQPVGLQLPLTVDVKVVECDPGVRGDLVTGRTKPAKLETGLAVQVPETWSKVRSSGRTRRRASSSAVLEASGQSSAVAVQLRRIHLPSSARLSTV